jgi:hypothetical protein
MPVYLCAQFAEPYTMKTAGKHRYRCSTLELMGSQLHAPASLLPGKEAPVRTGYEDGLCEQKLYQCSGEEPEADGFSD